MSLKDVLCACGRPIRYSHKERISGNKCQVCPTYEELYNQLEMHKNLLRHYQGFANTLDDYFEYRNESVQDRRKVIQMLENLSNNLKEVIQ